jgi:hypothetical protein
MGKVKLSNENSDTDIDWMHAVILHTLIMQETLGIYYSVQFR